MKRTLLALTFGVVSLAPLYSQVPGPITCDLNSPPPPAMRSNGASELVRDVVMTCSNPGPSASVNVNIQIFLNVDLTSRIMNPVTKLTEGLLLIDDPLPGVANTSNGFPYFGQVLGTPGVAAGAPGSGNVYQSTVFADNTIVWTGVPFVTGGTRIFRMTNIRANPSLLGGAGPILSDIAMSGPVAVVITNPRIENTPLGPLTAVRQDNPGVDFCTESGFTPEFSSVTPNDIGSATTGTRLLAELSKIPPPVFEVVVPNEVTSSSGNLVAHRVLPPLGGDFASGTVTTSSGTSLVFVSPARTAELLYEVTAAAPFQGRNGCGTIDAFDIPLSGIFPVSLKPVKVIGRFAPVDGTKIASPTAPEPRFIP